MHNLALSKGGKCLSTIFKNVDTKLKWECSCGNIWDALPQSILRGTWCKKCGNKRINQSRKLSLEKMKSIAYERGGDCLSLIYENNDKLLKWICKEGHIWLASASHITRGSWCKKCATAKSRIPINKLRNKAKDKGGKLLASNYRSNKDLLLWQCANGHTWQAKANTILSGFWCPICSKFQYYNEELCREIFQAFTGNQFIKRRFTFEGSQLELDGYCKELKIGFEYNGKQHYKFIKRFHKTIKEFENQKIRDNKKIEYCNISKIHLIVIPYDIASKGDGEVMNFIYKKLIEAGISNLLPQNSIKVEKIFNHIKNLEQLNNLAIEKGGKCLSNTYLGNQVKLEWQCQYGHVWNSKPNDIKSGHWCPYCANNKRRDTIEIFKIIATNKGGACLSKEYLNSTHKLEFSCNKGHKWMATPKSIKSGSWCPLCSHEKLFQGNRITIQKIRNIAIERGGECISKEYSGKYKLLKFKCNLGHCWMEYASRIRKGYWCPECQNASHGRNCVGKK